MSELVKGEIYCVSCGENFIPPKGKCLNFGYLRIIFPELQKSCGYAGTTREEGLPYVRSLRKVSTFNQQISAKSVGTRNKKLILNDIILALF